MEGLKAGDLAIGIEERDGVILGRWTGKSTDRQPGRVLEPFFAALLADATTKKAVVEMHFDQLLHFNSSTIGCLIQLIQDSKNASVALVLAYDAAIAWQRLSFDALRIFTKTNTLLVLRPVREHEQASV
jgi:hypothetical protein